MTTNQDVVVIFPIYGQFGAIWKPDSGRIVCKTYIFINSNVLPKNAGLLQKNAGISKIKRALILKCIFSDTAYVFVLMYQISCFWRNSNKF